MFNRKSFSPKSFSRKSWWMGVWDWVRSYVKGPFVQVRLAQAKVVTQTSFGRIATSASQAVAWMREQLSSVSYRTQLRKATADIIDALATVGRESTATSTRTGVAKTTTSVVENATAADAPTGHTSVRSKDDSVKV